jgi:hypothetical protein
MKVTVDIWVFVLLFLGGGFGGLLFHGYLSGQFTVWHRKNEQIREHNKQIRENTPRIDIELSLDEHFDRMYSEPSPYRRELGEPARLPVFAMCFLATWGALEILVRIFGEG